MSTDVNWERAHWERSVQAWRERCERTIDQLDAAEARAEAAEAQVAAVREELDGMSSEFVLSKEAAWIVRYVYQRLLAGPLQPHPLNEAGEQCRTYLQVNEEPDVRCELPFRHAGPHTADGITWLNPSILPHRPPRAEPTPAPLVSEQGGEKP